MLTRSKARRAISAVRGAGSVIPFRNHKATFKGGLLPLWPLGGSGGGACASAFLPFAFLWPRRGNLRPVGGRGAECNHGTKIDPIVSRIEGGGSVLSLVQPEGLFTPCAARGRAITGLE